MKRLERSPAGLNRQGFFQVDISTLSKNIHRRDISFRIKLFSYPHNKKEPL